MSAMEIKQLELWGFHTKKRKTSHGDVFYELDHSENENKSDDTETDLEPTHPEFFKKIERIPPGFMDGHVKCTESPPPLENEVDSNKVRLVTGDGKRKASVMKMGKKRRRGSWKLSLKTKKAMMKREKTTTTQCGSCQKYFPFHVQLEHWVQCVRDTLPLKGITDYLFFSSSFLSVVGATKKRWAKRRTKRSGASTKMGPEAEAATKAQEEAAVAAKKKAMDAAARKKRQEELKRKEREQADAKRRREEEEAIELKKKKEEEEEAKQLELKRRKEEEEAKQLKLKRRKEEEEAKQRELQKKHEKEKEEKRIISLGAQCRIVRKREVERKRKEATSLAATETKKIETDANLDLFDIVFAELDNEYKSERPSIWDEPIGLWSWSDQWKWSALCPMTHFEKVTEETLKEYRQPVVRRKCCCTTLAVEKLVDASLPLREMKKPFSFDVGNVTFSERASVNLNFLFDKSVEPNFYVPFSEHSAYFPSAGGTIELLRLVEEHVKCCLVSRLGHDVCQLIVEYWWNQGIYAFANAIYYLGARANLSLCVFSKLPTPPLFDLNSLFLHLVNICDLKLQELIFQKVVHHLGVVDLTETIIRRSLGFSPLNSWELICQLYNWHMEFALSDSCNSEWIPERLDDLNLRFLCNFVIFLFIVCFSKFNLGLIFSRALCKHNVSVKDLLSPLEKNPHFGLLETFCVLASESNLQKLEHLFEDLCSLHKRVYWRSKQEDFLYAFRRSAVFYDQSPDEIQVQFIK